MPSATSVNETADADHTHETSQDLIISSDVDVFASLPRLHQFTSRETFRRDPVSCQRGQIITGVIIVSFRLVGSAK